MFDKNKNSGVLLKTLSEFQDGNIRTLNGPGSSFNDGVYITTQTTHYNIYAKKPVSMDRGYVLNHGIAKGWIWLSDWTEGASTGDKRDCTKIFK